MLTIGQVRAFTERRLILDFPYALSIYRALILCPHRGNVQYREVTWHPEELSFIAKAVTSLLVCGILPTTASVCPQLTTGEQKPGLVLEEGPVVLQSSS